MKKISFKEVMDNALSDASPSFSSGFFRGFMGGTIIMIIVLGIPSLPIVALGLLGVDIKLTPFTWVGSLILILFYKVITFKKYK
jgi:maltodextrin utilization protein YvdJ